MMLFNRLNVCARFAAAMFILVPAAMAQQQPAIKPPEQLEGDLARAKSDAVEGAVKKNQSPSALTIDSRASLVHLGSLDSFDKTEQGTAAAKYLLDGLSQKTLEPVRMAQKLYREIIPSENFGGEYSALLWFCDYLLASRDEQAKMVQDPFHRAYFDLLAKNDFATLKEYIGRKYDLARFDDSDTRQGHERSAFLEDFILFSNPRRETWEKTSTIVDSLKIRKGMVIADVGSGPGYYTTKFSKLVGDEGRVLAIEMKDEHLDFLKEFVRKYDIRNIDFVHTRGNKIGCEDNSVDMVYICSVYHVIYATSLERVKDEFIESIKSALKKDGKLVIVDNALVSNKDLPYHGPYIAKELIIAQLKYYGFKLVEYNQFIPQRYILTFQVETPSPAAAAATPAGK